MEAIRIPLSLPERHPSRKTRVVLVSTYPPRRCGIATFTQDLRNALADVAPDLETRVCAVDREELDHPAVDYVLRQDTREDYAAVAARIAADGAGVVVIEHEYGIFGGPDGVWITEFAGELHRRGVPYLVTLHTVLSAPSAGQAAALRRLCRDAFAVTVFTRTARRFALETGIVAPADRIAVLPHGAPTVLRSGIGLDDRAGHDIRPEVSDLLVSAREHRLLSTFGLVSPGKGLEHAIAAVAEVVEAHPDVRYVIAGATHPEIVRRHGEEYRIGLSALAADLGVGEHVRFLDFFLTDAEIALLLNRTEVFLTPYRSRDQISSGALTFAVAAGCPVVSTSFHYAEDLLGGGAGLTVHPDDHPGFVRALRAMLGEPRRLARARAAARELGATLGWPTVASRFADTVRMAAVKADAVRVERDSEEFGRRLPARVPAAAHSRVPAGATAAPASGTRRS
ncbi:glycosyltransferase [Catenulispora subtropica]|uniref:Glycosyltransferase family 4 protein n=1 Tax=Catenulispora subtropica TaxID=450798 RepID=A0ABN2TGK4_9ACTN